MPDRSLRALAAFTAVAIAVYAAREPAPEYQTIPAAPTEELTAALAAPENAYPGDWVRAHGDNTSGGYSSLRQITRENVQQMKLAWTYHSGDLPKDLSTVPGLESNPVVVDGVMYGATAGDAFVAIDAASGHEIWRFKPEGQPAVRGLVYWRGEGANGPRLFFSSGNWMYALEAGTGHPAESFGSHGRVAARATVAPSIYRNMVILPCWNVMRAFDVVTGEPVWHFELIAEASKGLTWGANSWGGMALDDARGIAYVSTGSPHPNFLGMKHPGDDLYANSVVALKAETGELLWHFQEVRHDIWDWDIPAPPNLVTVTREGKRFDAVAQVTKIGNTLVLDRLTGRPLFPIRLRRAPASDIPGEATAEWQPDIDLPEPFARRTFSPDQITELNPAAKAYVTKKIAKAKARFGWFMPISETAPTIWYSSLGGAEWTGAAFDPEQEWLFVNANDFPCWSVVRKLDVPAPVNTPGSRAYAQYCAGCHAADRTGTSAPSLLPYVGRQNMTAVVRIAKNGYRSMPPVPVPEARVRPLMDFLSGKDASPKGTAKPAAKPLRQELQPVWLGRLTDEKGYPGVKPPWGTLNAVNLRTGHIEWKVPLGEYEELTKAGVPVTGTENFGATVLTATGIIFCAGTPDQKLRAFDSRTGALLWEYKLPFAAYAQPAVYQAGGREFLVIAATGGGKPGSPVGDAYVAFGLGNGPPETVTARRSR